STFPGHGFGDQADATYTASLSATENIFAGLQDRARVEQAQYNRAGSEASLEGIRAQLSFDLKSAFAGLYYAQQAIALAKDIIERREFNWRLVELRFDSGRENKGSYLLSKAYLAEANYDYLQAVDFMESARPQLAKALGRMEYEKIEVTGQVPV